MPLVAVAITLLSLAIWVAADANDALSVQTRRLRAQLRLELAATSAEARVAHLLLTEPLSQRAVRVGGPRFSDPVAGAQLPDRLRYASGEPVRELFLDGRIYRWSAREPLLIALQDEAGLINLNGSDEGAISRALELTGVPAVRAQLLAGALADFTDGDSLRRLNGAEADEYRRAGRSPPPNAPLRSENGVLAAFGWRDLLAPDQKRRLFALCTALPASHRFNLNTAPAEVLAAALGLDARATQILLDARQNRALHSLSDVAALTGVSLPGGNLAVGALPNGRVRLTARFEPVSPQDEGFMYASRLIIAPRGADRPFYWQRTGAFTSGVKAGIEKRSVDGDLDELPQSPALSAP